MNNAINIGNTNLTRTVAEEKFRPQWSLQIKFSDMVKPADTINRKGKCSSNATEKREQSLISSYIGKPEFQNETSMRRHPSPRYQKKAAPAFMLGKIDKDTMCLHAMIH